MLGGLAEIKTDFDHESSQVMIKQCNVSNASWLHQQYPCILGKA